MTVVREYNELITSVESQRDALVIILTASRADGEERLPITEAQKETAASAARRSAASTVPVRFSPVRLFAV